MIVQYNNGGVMKLSKLFCCIFISIITVAGALSQDLESKVTTYKLKNGLTILITERHEAPIFTAAYAFKVGSVDEVTGITGVAHLFEHMAFKGTTKIGTKDYAKEKIVLDEINLVGRELSLESMKGVSADGEKIKKLKEKFAQLDKEEKKYINKDEIFTIYNNEGGVGLNASTSSDYTQFFVSLPVNKFEIWCVIESERMKDAVLREFYTERNVVQEERKQTTEASPMRQLSEMFLSAAFVAHPYGHPVVGWSSDIKSVTLEEAYEFKSKYYVPNNCVISIVGDVNPKTLIPIIEKYFGDLKPGRELLPIRTVEPEQLGERRITLAANAEPVMFMGFHKPTFPSKDDAVMSVITGILTQGRTSRLQKDLVQDKQIAFNLNAGSAPGQRYDNLFIIQAAPRSPHTNEELEKAIMEHLDRLKTEPVTPGELQKIKNNLEANYIRGMKTNQGLAMVLMRYQLLFGDWKNYLKMKEDINSITPEDIMAVAKKYFTTENKTVAYLIKKAK
jgi:predicted Zn-dependent peptidase